LTSIIRLRNSRSFSAVLRKSRLKRDTEIYSEEETVAQREAALRRMLSSPHSFRSSHSGNHRPSKQFSGGGAALDTESLWLLRFAPVLLIQTVCHYPKIISKQSSLLRGHSNLNRLNVLMLVFAVLNA